MSMSSFLRLTKTAIIFAGVIVGIMGITYACFVFYKKKIKQEEVEIKILQFLLYALFIGYLAVVVYATLGDRSSHEQGFHFDLFSSYRYAWDSMSMIEWRNLILNILMFVPLGFFLPCLCQKLQIWWKTYGIGFGLTILIEIMQLITHRGLFEIDDIFNNTLGCIIGFGLFSLIKYLRKKPRRVLLLQIPLIMTMCFYVGAYFTYQNQELGHLKLSHQNVSISAIDLHKGLNLSSQKKQGSVYYTKTYSQEECEEKAKQFFTLLGVEIDSNEEDIYDESIYFYSKNREHRLSIDYIGGTMSYSNSTDNNNLVRLEHLSMDKIRESLKTLEIDIPLEASLSELDGIYEITFDMIAIDDYFLDGTLNCIIGEKQIVSNVDYYVKQYVTYKEYPLISEEEAYQKLISGQYLNYSTDEELGHVSISKVKLIYQMDTKGFYQPVYSFMIESQDREHINTLYVPAIA